MACLFRKSIAALLEPAFEAAQPTDTAQIHRCFDVLQNRATVKSLTLVSKDRIDVHSIERSVVGDAIDNCLLRFTPGEATPGSTLAKGQRPMAKGGRPKAFLFNPQQLDVEDHRG